MQAVVVVLLGFFAVFSHAAQTKDAPNVLDFASAITGATIGGYANGIALLGTEKLPAHSCRQIAELRRDVDNGVYHIKSVVTGDSFPVFCDMANGGYTMVYKAVSGVSGNVADVWTKTGVSNEEQVNALNTNNFFKGHYKNRIVDEWRSYRPKEVVVVLYKGGAEVVRMVFDGHLSRKNSWFTKQRLAFSPYTDLKTSSTNYFGIQGHKTREWFINKNYGGCGKDAGWLVFYSPGLGCSWEPKTKIQIKYSRTNKAQNWSNGNVGEADAMAVFVD
ncbi:uncharacterized protein LOC134193008 [Corticium candelabrum]|uniref:uncharacterized protein LOC134193008 n=1 Tax=Corticium candelabrum TaxID=121492 RepID=UPI002E26DD20|nr:uncharacterized protein LOC134193008 [Corticium candelabrum]